MKKDAWYPLIGASNHICNMWLQKYFLNQNLMNPKVIIILLLDVSKSFIKGKGEILINSKNERYQFISNGYYVSIMKNNTLNLD